MKIKILAPSACVDANPIHLAKTTLEEFGNQAVFSTHLFQQHRYLAGTVEERLVDLKNACEDPSIDAIWCGRGGTGAAQLLPYLDNWILNKPLIGYSDSTVLLNYIARHGGQAIHAPVFQEIAVKNLNTASNISTDAQEVLTLLNPLFQNQHSHYPIEPLNIFATQAPELRGNILGGNLATLCSLQGTPWALQLNQPTILLLEDVGEPYYRLERLFVQLLQSIEIHHLKAIVLGDFYNCPQKNVPHTITEIFNEYLAPLNVPMYSGIWFGHGTSNRPFWIGKSGIISDQTLSI